MMTMLMIMMMIMMMVTTIRGFPPEWCMSSMIYSGDTPFWSETLDINNVDNISSISNSDV